MKKSSAGSGVLNKRELKRLRAELINEKSRVLGVLNKKIDDIEAEIMFLEEANDENNEKLLEASTKGDGDNIKKLSKEIHESTARIESLFSDLERLHGELDVKAIDFEEKLNGLQAV
jgi:ATP-binding cassette subfamily F protein 3